MDVTSPTSLGANQKGDVVLPFEKYSKSWLTQKFCLSPFPHYDPNLIDRAKAATKMRGIKAFVPAAVMVPLVERDGELFLILTRRASHLKHHPGQISFPGGKVDPEDIDAFSTAVREMEEEIGVTTSRDDMLGSLPALPTITGYHVTPILSFVDSSYIASINEQEVDCLFELPLGLILDKSSWNSQQIRFNGKSYNIDAIHFEGHLIWGVTAQILRAFIAQLGFK